MMGALMTVHAYPFRADRLDLDPKYAELRDGEPLSRVQLPFGEEAWLVTRYQDVRLVLGDPRFSRAASVGRDEPRHMPQNMMSGMLSMDPPEHTRLRRLIAKAFTARRVEALRPFTQRTADSYVDAMLAKGAPGDLVRDFAEPLPAAVICELLGVPFEDRDRFQVWSEAIISTTSLPPETIGQYYQSLFGYIAGLVAKRRAEPDVDDLIGALVRVRDDDDGRLSEQEMVQLIGGLLAAGQETTTSQLPNFFYVLMTFRDEWERLVADPALIPSAVEELMRYVPLGVGAAIPRYALEDVAFGDVVVRAGEPVLVSLASANRDPDVFERPDTLDLERRSNPHIGFGHGAHHCVGAQLARMELQVALTVLTRRLPGLAPAVPPEELKWKSGRLVRALSALPVTW
jgi:cytochrome P450